MEGISGIVGRDETLRESPRFESSCRLMTLDINAAVEGAVEGGATSFIVSDSHGVMRNVLQDELNPNTTLVRGWPRPLSQLEGISEDVAGAFFLGYHAKRGAKGALMDHTIDSRVIREVRLNGEAVGEIGINAMVCGHFNVPVALVSGDLAATLEAQSLLGNVETVSVKEAVGRYSARCTHPKEARRMIREAAGSAVRRLGEFVPLRPRKPVMLEVDLVDTGMADMVELVPKAERIAGCTIRYESHDYLELYGALRALISLSREILFEKL